MKMLTVLILAMSVVGCAPRPVTSLPKGPQLYAKADLSTLPQCDLDNPCARPEEFCTRLVDSTPRCVEDARVKDLVGCTSGGLIELMSLPSQLACAED